MTRPQEPGPGWAADVGHLRVSDLDRERMVGFLKTAFVQGQLSRIELDRRTGQAYEARTCAELAAATAGIAAVPAPRESGPAQRRTHPRPAARKAIIWALSSIIVLSGLSVAVVATYYGGFIILLLAMFVALVQLDSYDSAAVRRHRAY